MAQIELKVTVSAFGESGIALATARHFVSALKSAGIEVRVAHVMEGNPDFSATEHNLLALVPVPVPEETAPEEA